MAEYYVIRDKNTGLYFRGKGVNRWGKYYNQASIYRVRAMAEHSIKEISWRGEKAEVVPIQIIENPTDFMEAVRCKDCKKGHPELVPNCGVWCALWNHIFPDDGFCSCGERKDNDG